MTGVLRSTVEIKHAEHRQFMKTHYWLRRSAALLCLAAILPFNCGRAEDQPKAPETTPAAQPDTRFTERLRGILNRASETIPAAQPEAKGRSASPYQLEIGEGFFRLNGMTRMDNGRAMEPTLANVVDALRDLWPEANIALAPEVSKLKMADLKLRSAGGLSEALEALRVASGYRFEWRRGLPNTGGPMIDPATGLPGPAVGGESSLYILDLGIDPQRNPLERARRMVQVFNMSGYLEHVLAEGQNLAINGDTQRADGTLAAKTAGEAVNELMKRVNRFGSAASGPLGAEEAQNSVRKRVDQNLAEIEKTVLETLDSLGGGNVSDNDRPHFQFHPGTGLLIVTGPPDAIEVARKVVTALAGQSSVGGGSFLAPSRTRTRGRRRRKPI